VIEGFVRSAAAEDHLLISIMARFNQVSPKRRCPRPSRAWCGACQFAGPRRCGDDRAVPRPACDESDLLRAQRIFEAGARPSCSNARNSWTPSGPSLGYGPGVLLPTSSNDHRAGEKAGLSHAQSTLLATQTTAWAGADYDLKNRCRNPPRGA